MTPEQAEELFSALRGHRDQRSPEEVTLDTLLECASQLSDLLDVLEGTQDHGLSNESVVEVRAALRLLDQIPELSAYEFRQEAERLLGRRQQAVDDGSTLPAWVGEDWLCLRQQVVDDGNTALLAWLDEEWEASQPV